MGLGGGSSGDKCGTGEVSEQGDDAFGEQGECDIWLKRGIGGNVSGRVTIGYRADKHRKSYPLNSSFSPCQVSPLHTHSPFRMLIIQQL